MQIINFIASHGEFNSILNQNMMTIMYRNGADFVKSSWFLCVNGKKTQLWIMLQLICTVLDTRLDTAITKYILPFHLHKSSACHRFSMAQKQGVGILESSDCACSVFLFPIGFPFWHGCQTRRRWNKRFNYMLLLCCVIYRLLVIKSVRTSTFRFL